MRPPRVSVFAVEDRSVQLCWPSLPALDGVLEVGDRAVALPISPPAWLRRRGRRPRPLDRGPGGPGAVVVEGLEPATTYDVCWSAPGVPRRRVAEATTLAPPPGRLLSRFATISDCHLGERHFGFFGLLEDDQPPRGPTAYPLRCARAAINEAVAWGAEALVVKGDLTQSARPAQVMDGADLLASSPIPIEVVLGNHDVVRGADPRQALAEGSPLVTTFPNPRARDLAGVRLILADTPLPGTRHGNISDAQAAALAELAGRAPSSASGAPGPAVIALHHPLKRWPVESHYPPGLDRAATARLVGAVRAANPNTVVLAGHTHRNRSYRVGGLVTAEVGSTKDYPGQWAGYAVYEGGIRQVVRRVAAPDVLGWTEATRRALGGVWGWWSPGSLTDRCWTLEWQPS